MEPYLEQFSPDKDFDTFDGVPKVLVIAFTPRCGSHMLGHTLYETGAFGFPLEYVNPFNLAEWRRRLGKRRTTDVLRDLQRRRTSPNGVFGIKLGYSHLDQLGGSRRLTTVLPKARYVLLRRENLISQAVSYAKAKQTGVWISGQRPTRDEAHYDFRSIRRCLRRVILETAAWQYLLATSGCRYIELTFESVLQDVPGAVQSIARLMEIDVDESRIPSQPPTRRQRNELNESWISRFLEDQDGSQLFSYRGGALRAGLISWARRLARR
jgi:LPS sulfotransferase NodH